MVTALCVLCAFALMVGARLTGTLGEVAPTMGLLPASTGPAESPGPVVVAEASACSRCVQFEQLAPPISDARLRTIVLEVRSVHDHIRGVTAAEVTEMAVALARQRGIELRDKP